jgi:hypothetical protein
MTPFTLLEKSAAIPIGTILSALKSFGKGLARAPGDAVSASSGLGSGQFFSNLAARNAALRGDTAAGIGNLAGHLGIVGGGVYTADKALGGEDNRAKIRKKFMEELNSTKSTWRDQHDPWRNPNVRTGIRLGRNGAHPDWRPPSALDPQTQRSTSEF